MISTIIPTNLKHYRMSKYKNTLIEIIVTCFFTGKIKFAPVTFGSLLAFPLTYYLVGAFMKKEYFADSALITTFTVLILTILGLFFIGWFCSSIYVKTTGLEDPKEVVIDEVVGQMIAIVFGSVTSVFAQESGLKELMSAQGIDFCFLFLAPFVLFRLFDIFKPWPIDWIDKNVHGGLGIMLDDVLAGVFAVVMQYFLTFIIVDRLI